MLFKQKKPSAPERTTRRVVQQPSQRSAVFSYHASRTQRTEGSAARTPVDRTPPARASIIKRLQSFRKTGPPVLVLSVVLVVTLMSLRLSSDPAITSVTSDDTKLFLRDSAVYRRAAQKLLATPANSNKLTINTTAIASELSKQFPEVVASSVSLPFIGSQPTVYIQTSAPKMILSTQSGLYVLDASGRALIMGNQVPSLSKLGLPVITDESGLAITVGAVALPRTTVAFIAEVAYQLAQKDTKVIAYTLPGGHTELHVRPEGAGYHVKYNLYGNAREQVGAHLALKQRLDVERKTPKDYIDARVDGRVYYK